MATLEKGKVEFFNSDIHKMYGFLRLESGEEIFFHYNDCRLLNAGDGGQFSFYSGRWNKPSRLPRPDDVIYFLRDRGANGRPKASPWCFKQEYDRAVSELVRRPRYKIVRWPSAEEEQEILWEGTNLDALIFEYPRRAMPDPDELRGGDIFFYRKIPGGNWEFCDDPRRPEYRVTGQIIR